MLISKEKLFIEVDQEIPFHDIDSLDVVWHGHYIKYFEIARCALLEKINYNYLQMRSSGYSWPVIDLRVRYAKPALFGQIITIRAELVEWQNWLKVSYTISDKQTGKKLTKGYTIQVAVDIENKIMCFESPAVFLEKLPKGLRK